ncbi:MAG: YdcF family protein [Clostridiaceae bacterium]|nr:YdcF family protein [Clostridiaceae bacterium]
MKSIFFSLLIRFLLVLLSAYGFWVFLQPLTAAGIINIGNAFGMISFVLFAVVVLFSSKISRFLSARMKKRRSKIVIVSIAVFLCLCLIWCGVLSALMATAASGKPQNPATVIVLGCRVNGDTPSLALMRRIETAADYLLENPSLQVIVSGGQGPDEWITEAEAMKRVLIQKGVSEDRILLEDRSTSTLENLEFSKALIEKNGLGSSVVIISEGYHMYRALSIAKRVGLDAEGLAAPTVRWLLPTFWVREWFGITLEPFRG